MDHNISFKPTSPTRVVKVSGPLDPSSKHYISFSELNTLGDKEYILPLFKRIRYPKRKPSYSIKCISRIVSIISCLAHTYRVFYNIKTSCSSMKCRVELNYIEKYSQYKNSFKVEKGTQFFFTKGGPKIKVTKYTFLCVTLESDSGVTRDVVVDRKRSSFLSVVSSSEKEKRVEYVTCESISCVKYLETTLIKSSVFFVRISCPKSVVKLPLKDSRCGGLEGNV